MDKKLPRSATSFNYARWSDDRFIRAVRIAEVRRKAGDFTSLEHAAVVAAAVFMCGEPRPRSLEELIGKEVATVHWMSAAVSFFGLGKKEGDVGGAAFRIAEEVPSANSGYPTKDIVFRWSHELVAVAADALDRTSLRGHFHHIVESWLEDQRTRYPMLFSVAAVAFGMIASAVLGYLLGRGAP